MSLPPTTPTRTAISRRSRTSFARRSTASASRIASRYSLKPSRIRSCRRSWVSAGYAALVGRAGAEQLAGRECCRCWRKSVRVVEYSKAATNAPDSEEVSLAISSCSRLDILGIIREGNEQAMAELDDRIMRFVIDTLGPRPDKPMSSSTREEDRGRFPVFEVMPLVRSLRRLATRSRAAEVD